jgi:hypothetical protein
MEDEKGNDPDTAYDRYMIADVKNTNSADKMGLEQKTSLVSLSQRRSPMRASSYVQRIMSVLLNTSGRRLGQISERVLVPYPLQ